MLATGEQLRWRIELNIVPTRYMYQFGDAGHNVNNVQLHALQQMTARQRTNEAKKSGKSNYCLWHWTLIPFVLENIYMGPDYATLKQARAKSFASAETAFVIIFMLFRQRCVLFGLFGVAFICALCSSSDTRFLLRPWMFVDVINFYCDFFSCVPLFAESHSHTCHRVAACNGVACRAQNHELIFINWQELFGIFLEAANCFAYELNRRHGSGRAFSAPNHSAEVSSLEIQSKPTCFTSDV